MSSIIYKEGTNTSQCQNSTIGRYIYLIFNINMTIISLYLASCSGFHITNIIISLVWPYIYIVYSIIKHNGICKKN
jgi:hypothetical protein